MTPRTILPATPPVPATTPGAGGAVPTADPREITVQEIATILARGYLRLLARKATPGAASHLEPGLDDVSERSPHGRHG